MYKNIKNQQMKISHIIILATLPFAVFSQKNKVQGAWRSLSDYESTLKESPDVSYLLKAKEDEDKLPHWWANLILVGSNEAIRD